jgi:pyruvate/2-oxoglutarate dehydrogenase complex dihydrolipoamide dehydrogenase (E3) component
MAKTLTPDICVIGGGSAGLAIAAGASQMGAPTVLVERGRMGGDCLNYGCVPSKSLLAAAKAAGGHVRAARFGVRFEPPRVDFRAVHDHVHGVIAAIAPQDSVERFEGMGVTVIQERARFVSPREIEAGEHRVRARRFVVATGSRPLVPPIPGLEDVPYLTNETVFGLTECPRHLIVIGGGPIGCELGQAFRRLGAEVSILEMASILPKDDAELVDILRGRLRGDGLALHEATRVVGVERAGEGVAVRVERDGAPARVEGDALLVAAGRKPGLEDLGLEAAGIEYDRAGIKVDARLRSSNRRVFAAGDVSGGYQFTHVAGYHAGVVIKNALFRLPAKADMRAVPWVTYTDPELAHVGLGEEAAAERATECLVKVVATPRGRVLGASILGIHAGDLIQPWVLAIAQGLKLSALAQMVAPYPTRGEASKRAAGSFFAPKLFSERTKRLVRLLARLG